MAKDCSFSSSCSTFAMCCWRTQHWQRCTPGASPRCSCIAAGGGLVPHGSRSWKTATLLLVTGGPVPWTCSFCKLDGINWPTSLCRWVLQASGTNMLLRQVFKIEVKAFFTLVFAIFYMTLFQRSFPEFQSMWFLLKWICISINHYFL